MEIYNPFNRKASQYGRDIDVKEGYIEQTAMFISRSTGRPYEEAVEFIREELVNGTSPMKDPMVCVLERNDEGDREKKAYPFTVYLQDAVDRGLYIAPTFSQVLPPSVKVSLLSNYIKGNLAERNEEKHKQLVAKNKQDYFRATIHKNNQNNKKILNNAISGNHRSPHSHLHDRSTHPILTSCCRIANGVANSHNERFLAGNRHYYSTEIVLNNFNAILMMTDFSLIDAAIYQFGLHIPTVDEIMAMVVESANAYWENRTGLKNIRRLVKTFTAAERCAVMYIGDFYHLRIYNDDLARNFIKGLSTRATETIVDHEEWLKRVDGDIINQVKVMFPDVLGREELNEPSLRNNPDFGLVGATCKSITKTLWDHRTLIDAFWVTKNIPFLISDFPSSLRKVTVGSDTDSAIFTVQTEVDWYSGNGKINHENMIIAETFGFLISQTTTHNLATMVANIGITDEKEMFRLSMKNEYLFPVFSLTSRAKHYWANMAVQEGVIIPGYDFEKKGVELIASNLAGEIRADHEKLLHYIIDSVTEDKKVSITKILANIARWEYTIYDSITGGSTEYLKSARVNEEEGYSTENSRFINYEMWQDVFGDEYGFTEAPPYSALAFSIIPDSKKKTTQWLENWSNREMAAKMQTWLDKRGKKYVGEMLLPESIIMTLGIPKEILPVIDVRKIISKAMSPFYLVLESLEYYCFDSKQSKLVMDMITREEASEFHGTMGDI